MAKQGLAKDPVIRKWLEMGRDDPLPEVRRVMDSWYGTTGVGTATGDERRPGLPKDADTDGKHSEGNDAGVG